MGDEKISNDSLSDDSDDFEDPVKCKIQRICSSSQEKGNTGSKKRRIVLVDNSVQDVHFRKTLPGKQNLKKRTHEDDSITNVKEKIQKSNESSEEKSITVLAKRRIVPDKGPVVGDSKTDVKEPIQKSKVSSEEKRKALSAKRRIVPNKSTVVDDSKTDVKDTIQKSNVSSEEKRKLLSAKRRIVTNKSTVVDDSKTDVKETIQKSNVSSEEKRKVLSAKRRIVPNKSTVVDDSKTDVKETIQKSNVSSQEKGNTGSKKRRTVLVDSYIQDVHFRKTLPGKQNLKKRTHGGMNNPLPVSKLTLSNVMQSTNFERKNPPSFINFEWLTAMDILKGSIEKFMEQYSQLKGKTTWTKYRDTEPTLHIGNQDINNEKQMNSFAIHNKQVVSMKLENQKIAASHPLSNGTRQKDVLTSDIKSMVSKSVGLIHVDNQPVGTGFRVGQKYIATCAHVLLKVTVSTHFIHSGRISIEFGRKKYNQKEDPNKIFVFQPTLAYLDNEYDFAVLELATHEAGVKFPPALTLFGEVCVSEIHLVGHPGGRQMKEDSDVIPRWLPDHENELGKYIQDLRQWSVNYFPDRVDYYKVLLDLPRKILFHTTFDMGSSGSPGFMIVDDKPSVVLMVSGGTPRCLYDKLFQSLSVEDIQKVEFGYAFSDIYSKMWNSKNQSVKNLSLDIFREWSQYL